ncbi:MAG TPA: FtsX-like permease family protein [Candidatus Saccharimonadales bacterium]|nr:FtsX-like permease family protein [Candidatus Saccharimonadales bacterium]
MNTFTLGVRNAFRNAVRSTGIMVILGLSIGLCLVMLIAHQAVGQKINDVKASVGNTITISPAGFSGFNQVSSALNTDDLAKVQAMSHVTSLVESLADRLTTIGSAQPSFGRGDNTSSNATTSLTSPVTIDTSKMHVFVSGGDSTGTLPANFSLPISIVGTTNPLALGGDTASISSGNVIDGTKDTNNALVSTSMASKNNLSVGSTFTAYGSTLTVAGIFKTSTQAADDTVVVALPTLQRLNGQTGDVTSAIATVDSLDNLSSVTTTIKNTFGSNADVTSAQDEADATVKPLENVANISLISLIGAIVAGSVIILMTMIMIVRERRREIGILKAIGASNTRVILQFMSEAVTLTLAGAVIGVLIGIAGGNPVTNMLVSSSTTTASTTSDGATAGLRTGGFARMGGGQNGSFMPRPLTGGLLQRNAAGVSNSIRNITTNIGWSILGYGLAAALLIAVLGSALAGWMIARVKPYEVMRAE